VYLRHCQRQTNQGSVPTKPRWRLHQMIGHHGPTQASSKCLVHPGEGAKVPRQAGPDVERWGQDTPQVPLPLRLIVPHS
jgi:hypothetical protein